MTNTLGDSLPEEQLGTQSQILRVLDEAKANDGPLSCSKLILKPAGKPLLSVSKCKAKEAKLTDLSVKALHCSRLPDITDMDGDLRPPPESLCVEEQNDGSFELTADGRVHLGADHHHALKRASGRCLSHVQEKGRNSK